MQTVRRLAAAVAVLALVTACGSSTAEDDTTDSTTSSREATQDDEASTAPEEPDAPRTQAESCDWDAPAVAGSGAAPAGQDGDLQVIVVGAWQHTHIDSGSGYEALDAEDIRYVFPSSTRMLYCQDVPGATHQGENAADVTWDGDRITPPGGHPGFTVLAWSDDAMVWRNHLDDSTYLLQRR